MQRRSFITLLGGAAAAWPLAARAQQPSRVPRIGILTSGFEDDHEWQARFAAFRAALEKFGWAESRNLHIDHRWGGSDPDRVRAFAAELISLAPNVVLASNTPTSLALRAQTSSIPIIFAGAADPLSSGLVDSLARPGGNVTGFTNFEFTLGGKWLEYLKDVSPGIKRVLVVLDPANIGHQGFLRLLEDAATVFGVQPFSAAERDAAELERAVGAFAQEPNGGVIVLPGPLANRDLIVGLATRHRLPTMYSMRPYIASGGLMSYDTDYLDLYRRVASYVDRILRGEKPGDLPVQNPTKYQLVINLKVAKALGLTVPLPLLAFADEVIE